MLLLGAGAAVLLSSPRHRSFYFGLPGGFPGASFSLTTRPVTRATVTGASRAALPPAAPRVPTADAEGRVRVPVADEVPWRLPAGGVPPGWELREFSGEASVELVRNEGRLALRLRSERSSFALHRDVVLDVRRHPVLTWSWKVIRLPSHGDVRDPRRDDQAAQVYVVFPRWPSPRTASDVIGYVWDSQAPAGTMLTHPRAANVKIVVLESGAARLDTWVSEGRNVAEDYRALFGRQPPRVGKVALMVDSNDTRSEAEVLIGDLLFARPGRPRTEIPTAMLR